MDFRKNGSSSTSKMEEYSGYGDVWGCSVFEQMQIGMAIVATSGNWLRVNSRLCEMLGYTESELLELDFKKLAHPDEPEPDFEIRAESFCGNDRVRHDERRFVRKDGETIWVRVSTSLTLGSENKPLYFISQIEDITGRKKAEMGLEASEKKFRMIFENASDGITINEPGGCFLEVNRVTCEKLGYSRAEFLQMKATDLIAPEASEAFFEKIRELYRYGHVMVEGKIICKEGSVLLVEQNMRFIEYGGRQAVLSITRDITERKKAEQMLKHERDCAQNYLDIAGTVIVAIDPEQKTLLINRKGAELLGYPKKDIIGKNWFDTFVPEKYRQKIKDIYPEFIRGNIESFGHFENPVLTRSGEERLIMWQNTFLRDGEGKIIGILSSGEDITERKRVEKEMQVKNAAMASALTPIAIADLEGDLTYINSAFLKHWGYVDEAEVLGRPAVKFWNTEEQAAAVVKKLFLEGTWEGELTARRKDGTEFPSHLSASMVRDEAGIPICMMGSFLDVSRNKEAERMMNEARLRAEDTSRAKSDFLASMSHELRTPLNSVIGFADLLQEESFGPLNEKQLKYISNISMSGKHLLKIINGILDLSKIETGKMELHIEEFSVPAAFEEIKTTLAPIASKKNIRIEDNLDREMEKIRADRTKFKQILYNLLDNAIKFTHENGLVAIDARAAGENVLIRVADSGPGISGENQKKLFHPFTQLGKFESREQPGTGLGLAIVKKFVEMHGGRIWVESEPGKGSVFTFMIPLKQEHVPTKQD
ncbi:PAS domain S-box protein [Methanosarcina sp. KYL-1]|uniref:PAS domain-containing sensor histidine kinase n=1 Tax=Methanosarcina sp. KYL-1 TaxID=2602068 RepID=UPI0021013824|nr:PAS domain S-box protein [Methanosarcina sp. KYL-1]MCQ1535755.1 PAS domain S-box protein [Methanosarcina sp. KYL-1]